MIRIRKSWLRWVGYAPDEPLGMIETHTYKRALSREKLIAKFKPRPQPAWEEVQL